MSEKTKKKLLYIGYFNLGSTCNSRLNDLKDYFYIDKYDMSINFPLWRRSISSVWRRIHFGPPYFLLFYQLKKIFRKKKYDIVLIEKNSFLYSRQLKFLKKLNDICFIMFCHDNVMIEKNSTPQLKESISFFDAIITTKNLNLEYYKDNGCKNVYLIDNAISKHDLLPMEDFEIINDSYLYDIGFIGRHEKYREELLYMLSSKINKKFIIAGPGWLDIKTKFNKNVELKGALWGKDYKKFIRSTRINIGLNSKMAIDTITSRTIEIPAYNGFMLTERNVDTLRVFGKELDKTLYSNTEELVCLLLKYLSNDKLRESLRVKQFRAISKKQFNWGDVLSSILYKYIS